MSRETIFLTGATGLLGGEVLARLLRAHPSAQFFALVRDAARWNETAARLAVPSGRVTPLPGDLRSPGLGLDARTRARLRRRVDRTIHLAADVVFSRPLEQARATNVEGTRHLLDVSSAWQGPIGYVSTAFVAGRRIGRILERDPGGEAGWVNAYEQSKWEAEQLVRESGRAFTILRSSTIVCDSVEGRVSQLNAVHRALRLFRGGLAPLMPGRETSPVDVVPGDYVADAVARLALRDDVLGETFHLCAGEGAIPLGEMLDLTEHVWRRDAAWRRRSIARPALCELPVYRLFERSVERAGAPRLKQVLRSMSHFVPQLALEKRFDTSGADGALGTPAPAVRTYWARMLDHLLEHDWAGAALHRAA
jgi:thioester reductase-like protein